MIIILLSRKSLDGDGVIVSFSPTIDDEYFVVTCYEIVLNIHVSNSNIIMRYFYELILFIDINVGCVTGTDILCDRGSIPLHPQ